MPDDPGGWTDFVEWMNILDGALRLEGIPHATAERVLNRVLAGGPDPARVYKADPVPSTAATTFLFVWLDTVLGTGTASGRCLKCREPIAAVTVGRREDRDAPAWFQIDPCGHLFDVDAVARPVPGQKTLGSTPDLEPPQLAR